MVIKLGEKQLKMLEPYSFELYVSELVEHCNQYYPQLNNTIQPQQLRQILREAVLTARQKGVTQRGPIRFYIDLMILFGAGFESDPQYHWIAQWLKDNSHYSQLEQADFLYYECLDYFETIHGEQNQYKQLFCNRLKEFDLKNFTITVDDFDNDVLAILKNIYPEKAEIAGDNALNQLIKNAKQKADTKYHYTRVGQNANYIILSYLYGHQFDNDPFLPSFKLLSSTYNKEGHYIDNAGAISIQFKHFIKQWIELKVS